MRKLINFFAFCFFGFVFISCGLTEPDEQKSFLTVTIGTDFISKLYSSETRGIGAENATAPLSYKAELTAMASDYMWTTSSVLTASKSANLVVPSIPANSSVSLTVKVMDSEGDVVYQGSTAVNAGVGQSLALNMNLSYAKDSALDFSLDTSSYYQIFGYYEGEKVVDFFSDEDYLNYDDSAQISLKNKNVVFVFGDAIDRPANATYYIWKLNGVELESHENPLVINLAKEADMANAKTPSLTCQPVYEYKENGEVKTNYGDSASYQYFRNFKFPDTDTKTLPLKEMAYYKSGDAGKWCDLSTEDKRSFCSEFYGVHFSAASQTVYTYEKADSSSSWVITVKEIRKDSFDKLVTVDIGPIGQGETWNIEKISYDAVTNKLWVFVDESGNHNNDYYSVYVAEYSAGVFTAFENVASIQMPGDCVIHGVYDNYIFYTNGLVDNEDGQQFEPGLFEITNMNETPSLTDDTLFDYSTDSHSFPEEFPEGKSCAHVTDIQPVTIGSTTYIYTLISDSYGKYSSGIYHKRGGVARLKKSNVSETGHWWEFDKEFGIKGLTYNIEDWVGHNSGTYTEFKATVPPYKDDGGYFYNPLSFCAIKDDYLVILDDGLFQAKEADPGEFTNRDRIMLFNLKTDEISKAADVFIKVPSSYIWDTVLR